MTASFCCAAVLAALFATATAPAQAQAVTSPPGVFNAPIVFTLPGSVTLQLEMSEGGFDHLLELASAPGAVGADPLLVLTALSDPSPSVLGHTPAAAGATASLGSVAAGDEIVLRLSNVGSARFGTPGVVEDQTFSGSASALNPDPTGYYTIVEWLSPTQVRVEWEDLFPVYAVDAPGSLGGADLRFTLTLTPVPEPGPQALLLAGLGIVGWLTLRHAGQQRRPA